MRVFYTDCHQFLFPFILSSSTLIRLSLANTPKLFLTKSFLPIKSNGHFQSSSDLTQSPVFATVHYSFLEILSSLAFQDTLLAVLSQPPFLAPPHLSSLSMLENSRICPRNASLLYLHLDSFRDLKETHSFKIPGDIQIFNLLPRLFPSTRESSFQLPFQHLHPEI